MALGQDPKHLVLVHGACHGAWSWHKVKPLLESAGHRVTVLDLTASGIHMKAIQDVHTFAEYTQPLLDFLYSMPSNEKVILVGHSLGGMNLALAMESFPEKIAVAVFLTAFMPDTVKQPSFVVEQLFERAPAGAWLDTQFAPYSCSQPHLNTIFFGPSFLSHNIYQMCPIEDLELAKTLVRPGSLFLHDLGQAERLTNQGYGSVKRVFVICKEDKAISEEFQRWMIENSQCHEVMEISGSGHMPMLSKPQECCHCLSSIAQKYA
uniref:(S)-hydroxynitrile lyase n=1 Tax=Rhizophora mucronata TaxID=61149 RepID=A0A2P2QNS6_RHIMU